MIAKRVAKAARSYGSFLLSISSKTILNLPEMPLRCCATISLVRTTFILGWMNSTGKSANKSLLRAGTGAGFRRGSSVRVRGVLAFNEKSQMPVAEVRWPVNPKGDFALQPRVARNALPWVGSAEDWFNPERVATGMPQRRNSVGVEGHWGGITQGSPGRAGATLGCGTESRWDSRSQANGNVPDPNAQELVAGKAGLRLAVCPGSLARPA